MASRIRISLQDYKLRKGVSSKNCSVTVRPEPMIPEISSRLSGKVIDVFKNSLDLVDDKPKDFDRIVEAANNTLMRIKKKKAEANRRREEAIIKSRMRNLENFPIQPLMPAETMNHLGISQSDHHHHHHESSDSSSRPSSTSSGSSSGYFSASTTSSRKSQRSSSHQERDENQNGNKSYRSNRESNTPVDERKIVFVGRLEDDVTKQKLGNKFAKYGRVVKVRLHSKEDGTRFGFVTYERSRDAWSAVKAAGTFERYDVRFGAHCAFFRQSDADFDGLEANMKSSSHGQAVPPPNQKNEDSY